VDAVIENGLHEFLDQLQWAMNSVDDAIFDTFFAMRPSPELTLPTSPAYAFQANAPAPQPPGFAPAAELGDPAAGSGQGLPEDECCANAT